MEKVLCPALELSLKLFSHWTSTDSATQHVGNSSSPPPLTKLILLHTVVVSHYTHHVKVACLVRRGKAGKMLKNKLL